MVTNRSASARFDFLVITWLFLLFHVLKDRQSWFFRRLVHDRVIDSESVTQQPVFTTFSALL